MKKILAADDDEGMRAFYGALLTDAGFEVELASDTAAAIETFFAHRPDLLVLDVDMPGGGGKRAFLTVRKILELGVPVIFVTGLPEAVQEYALFEQQVSIFRKPVKSEELLKEVRRLLKIPER